ncbi:MAG TPA: response regulator [bacterium]|nr:response regulator [bacterium]
MTSQARILVVDDEEDILELLRYHLEREGYRVCTLVSGDTAVETARADMPDLILLDLMLPGLNGFDITKRLKRDPETAHIPILMITARGEESDIVTGLELGAEDYITKPFSPKVLVARVRTVLRRANGPKEPADGPVRIGNLEIDPARFEMRVDGLPVDLTATEFHLLNFLVRHPGWVFTRSQIIDGIKGSDYPVTDRSVDVQIVGLRRKLGAAGKCIETVRGIGYRFRE